jgi:mycothiol synthase
MSETLPNELSVRAPTLRDVGSVVGLMNACDIAEQAEPEYTVEDLRADWQSPEVNLETDAWVIVAPGEQLVGYSLLFNRENVRLYADTYVHPEHRGRGIRPHLVWLTERRARQQVPDAPPGARITLYDTISSADKVARAFLEEKGFRLARHFWRMRIEMDEMPPAPELHCGITIRTFVPVQDDYATFEAMEEAFQDHWGHIPWRFESWQQHMMKRDDFDPSLWFLAIEGERIVGGSLCHSYPNEGWVNQLGVRRPWRRKGLGLALLHHSFRELYRRGQRRVSLGVDSQNTTGATRLYERAKMHVTRQFDSYEKVLRPGQETGKSGQT